MRPGGTRTAVSFAELDALSDGFAAFLNGRLGLHRGEALAVQLPNGLAFPIAVFGAWKAGLVVTAIIPSTLPPRHSASYATATPAC